MILILVSRRGVIALDVGGTSIKASVVCDPATVMLSTVEVFDSLSQASSSVILNHFRAIVLRQIEKAASIGVDVVGIGLAFPGPFDYENGVCLIHNLNKYESIYGANLREFLSAATGLSGVNVVFMNDADAFACGESAFGTGQTFNRAIYLTLGTGIGSTYIEHGSIVNSRAPYEGRVYLVPYRDGSVEDYVSRRGILKLANEYGVLDVKRDVVDIANAAYAGDPKAALVFQAFGEMMGEALDPVCQVFCPDGIVLGGQISKSANLFVPSLHRKLGLDIAVANDSLQSTWLGMYVRFTTAIWKKAVGGGTA